VGINDLFDTPPNGSLPAPRFMPRSPLSVKELTAILILAGLAWGAYDRLNKFAEKTAVEHVVETQWLQRLETQHNFDALSAKVDQLIKVQAESEKRQTAAEARRK
jgi:hypothetical protein